MSTLCQGFSHFSAFLCHFVLAKLATSSIRVNTHKLYIGAQCQGGPMVWKSEGKNIFGVGFIDCRNQSQLGLEICVNIFIVLCFRFLVLIFCCLIL